SSTSNLSILSVVIVFLSLDGSFHRHVFKRQRAGQCFFGSFRVRSYPCPPWPGLVAGTSFGLLRPGACAGLPDGNCPGGKSALDGAIRSSSSSTSRLISSLCSFISCHLLSKKFPPRSSVARPNIRYVNICIQKCRELISRLSYGGT